MQHFSPDNNYKEETGFEMVAKNFATKKNKNKDTVEFKIGKCD